VVTQDEAWQATCLYVKDTPPAEARRNLRALLTTDLGILYLVAAGREGYNVQLLDPVRVEGRLLEGVVLETASLGRLRVYLDPTTKRIHQVHYTPDDGGAEAVLTFSGHARFGPLTVAGRMEDSDPRAKAKAVELLGIQLNPKLEDGLFEKPSRVGAPEL